MCLVSVIIPNYNHGKYLKDRIESVLNQTYQSIEIILLDDCSSDTSLEVINQYRDNSKITQIIINQENTGSPFIQWEKGLALAKGKYIWIAESDDYAHPTQLYSLVNLIENNPTASVAFCNSNVVDDDANVIIDLDIDDIGYPESSVHRGTDFISYKMKYYTRIYNASSAIFSRACWERIPKAYTSYRSAGDYLFWIEIMRLGDVCWLHKKLNFYRSHPYNVTKSANNSGKNAEERYRQICYFKENAYFSYRDMIEIIGVEIISIFKLLSIKKGLGIAKLWLKSFPLIPLYILLSLFFKISHKFFYSIGLANRYPQIPLK